MKPRQFIAQLTAGGGPDALHELESLADEADGRAWLGTRVLGRALDLSGDSRCIAFAREPGGGVLALAA